MKYKYLAFCALALIAVHGTSGVSAMPQAGPSSSQRSMLLASGFAGTDLRQAASDPLGFDSGLWRTEYLTQPVDENDSQESQSISSSGGSPVVGAPSSSARLGNDNTFDSTIYSDSLAIMPIEIPVVIGKTEYHPIRESNIEASTPTMSDWEYAAVTASKNSTIGFTTSGPSATSAIVGFIGIVIVIGAYVSSGKSNP